MDINWQHVIEQSVDLDGYKLREKEKELQQEIKLLQAQKQQDVPVCYCNNEMVLEAASDCYDKAIPVICNICNKQITGMTQVWHCASSINSDKHSSGYDICLECVEKCKEFHQRERKWFASDLIQQKQLKKRSLEKLIDRYNHHMKEVEQFYLALVEDGDPNLVTMLRRAIQDKDTQIHTANIHSLILKSGLYKHSVLRNFNRAGVYYHISPFLLGRLASRIMDFISRSDWSPSLGEQLKIYVWSAGG
ncbi:hypothetical protein RFI_14872 [Reticulomyxa filosa]|uniref:Uncharacterized protein n=1 Tax=Reticulomyxa filosa TaxID=46433 RepID=X6N8F8_RETFI|nr:hypothetical protein RFI_14872 [Reticulomyxa filosa]|eukprot:ETO22326.1 hypothetical protein RFI_14872 [Reticulomyxa filosa]